MTQPKIVSIEKTAPKSARGSGELQGEHNGENEGNVGRLEYVETSELWAISLNQRDPLTLADPGIGNVNSSRPHHIPVDLPRFRGRGEHLGEQREPFGRDLEVSL